MGCGEGVCCVWSSVSPLSCLVGSALARLLRKARKCFFQAVFKVNQCNCLKIQVVGAAAARQHLVASEGRKCATTFVCEPSVDSTPRHRARRLLLSTDIKCILGKGEFQNITAVGIYPKNPFDKNPSCDSSNFVIWQRLCLSVSTSWTSRI